MWYEWEVGEWYSADGGDEEEVVIKKEEQGEGEGWSSFF